MTTNLHQIKSVYRNLLRHAQNLTANQNKDNTIRQIKQEFRAHQHEKNPHTIQELLDKAHSSLGYLRMITPKLRRNTQDGYTRIVFGDAENSSLPQKAVTNWTATNMDPDSVKRHYRGLKRAGYKNNRHAKGIF